METAHDLSRGLRYLYLNCGTALAVCGIEKRDPSEPRTVNDSSTTQHFADVLFPLMGWTGTPSTGNKQATKVPHTSCVARVYAGKQA